MDPFDTFKEAAEDGINYIRRCKDGKWEWGGVVKYDPESKKYYYDEVRTDYLDYQVNPLPAGSWSDVSAIFHTHTIEVGLSSDFDIPLSEGRNKPISVGLPSGIIKWHLPGQKR